MAVTLAPVTTPSEVSELAQMADEIWHEYWPALIGAAQTDYMVEQFQSLDAIKRDMSEHGYRYWFVVDDTLPPDEQVVGYTGGHTEPETNRFFISKIYLYQRSRGHGYARKVVEFYDALCRAEGLGAMYLTVNKGNELGIRAYKGTGFEIIDSVVNPIGEGFVMDDYVMERKVGNTSASE